MADGAPTAVLKEKAAQRRPQTEDDEAGQPGSVEAPGELAEAGTTSAPRRDEAKRTRDEAAIESEESSGDAARKRATPASPPAAGEGGGSTAVQAPPGVAVAPPGVSAAPAGAAVAEAAAAPAAGPEGSWTCPACGNVNYANRTRCNMRRCALPRPGLAGAEPGEDSAAPSANKRLKAEDAATSADGSWCVTSSGIAAVPWAFLRQH